MEMMKGGLQEMGYGEIKDGEKWKCGKGDKKRWGMGRLRIVRNENAERGM